jgi:hypothetical protein
VTEAVVPDAPPVKKEEEPRVEEKPKQTVIVENRAPAVTKAPLSLLPDTSKPAAKAPALAAKSTVTQPVVVPNLPKSSAQTPTTQTKPVEVPALTKVFNLPAGAIAHAKPAIKGNGQVPPPPGVASNRDYNALAIPPTNLPSAEPPRLATVSTAASAGTMINPRDPLEGEWVYAPKEPERQRPGFYPPEFIDLKLFGAGGDVGSLRGQYSAKYVVTDKPVSPEVTFELASTSKGSRKFVWQSTSGAKGTLNIDPIDDRTIRIDWHTTSAVRGPALTSGSATLVRRQ